MKNILIILFFVLLSLPFSFSQEKGFKLENVLVVAQQDKMEDRYSLEVSLIELLRQYNIKTMASLNVIKQGGSPKILLNDSVQNALKQQGIDTYMLISVRGYDKKFKPSEQLKSLEDELEAGHLFPVYRENITSVTFSVTFYRDEKPVHNELIKIGATGSREDVLKKLMKKLDKLLRKEWT